MKRILLCLLCILLVVSCKPVAVTPPVDPTPPIPNPSPVNPVEPPPPVSTKPTDMFWPVTRPKAITWIAENLSEDIGCLEMWPPFIMPGESVKLEFEYKHDPAEVAPLLTQGITDSTQYQLEWLDDKTVIFTLINTNEKALFLGPELDYWGCYEVVPAQKLVVLDKDYAPLHSVDIPISTRGAISMSPDYRQVRLARQVNLAWLHIGVQEYVFDIYTLKIEQGKLHSRGAGGVDYTLLDWLERTYEASQSVQIVRRVATGLSNNGMLLASYEHGQVRIADLLTKQSQVFPVDSISHSDVDFPNPQRVYWSYDDLDLYYTASTDTDNPDNLYRLNIATGVETMLLEGHYISSVSPFANHIFTEAGGSYLVDETGKARRLSGPEESVILTKWIDNNRILVNKSTESMFSGFFFNSKCYIYHLSEDRWEYICEGYGFDYDVATGRVFVLQNR